MEIVLALIIAGWLVSFALGAQTGFENQPVVVKSSPKAKPSPTQSTVRRERVSAA